MTDSENLDRATYNSSIRAAYAEVLFRGLGMFPRAVYDYGLAVARGDTPGSAGSYPAASPQEIRRVQEALVRLNAQENQRLWRVVGVGNLPREVVGEALTAYLDALEGGEGFGEFSMHVGGGMGMEGSVLLSVGGNDLDLSSPLFDFRADDVDLITESGGAVSAILSQNGSGGTITQSTAGNRPALSGGVIQFSSTGIDDADGDFLALSTGAGSIVQLYSADMEKLGIAYFLLRFPSIPTWGVNPFSILRNNASALNRNAFRFYVSADTGIMGMLRGASASQQIAALSTGIGANEWTAVAVVLNDDRTTPGSSDHISRIFAKTKAGGAMATMQSASSTALTLTGGTPVAGAIGREEYEDQRTGNWHLHSFAFDADPPTTNSAIEANLDKLLARV